MAAQDSPQWRNSDGFLTGKLLIAMPGMADPRFEKSVIFVCSHSADGALGLIVNKPLEGLPFRDLMTQMDIPVSESTPRVPVMFGGPVETDRGYVLHSEDFSAEDATQTVAPGINLTATRDVLMAMATDHPPERFVLALGHSNWGAGQLESELAGNAWLVAEPDQAIIFGDAHEGKWTSAIRLLGIEPSQIMGDSGRA